MEHYPPLFSHLQQAILSENAISFRDFMNMVLYAEEEGYYQQSRTKVGVQGDFMTSPHAHPLFNQLLANGVLQLSSIFHRILHPAIPFTIVEVGAGEGELAAAILSAWLEGKESKHLPLRYTLIEKSQHHRKKQMEKLLPYENEAIQISWLDSWDSLMDDPISGIILSNELFDALPTHLVSWEGGEPYELYVGIADDDENFRWIKKALPPPLSQRLHEWNIHSQPNERRFCISLDAEKMLTTMAQSLSQGWILSIDYGDVVENLLDSKLYPPQYSIRCYEAHRLYTDPLQRVGYRDLTSDVNFTQLIDAGSRANLQSIAYTTQASFLLQQGIGEIYAAMQQEALYDLKVDFELPKVRSLFDLDSNGTRFKFLLQGKGWPTLDWESFLDVWKPLSMGEMEERIPFMPWGGNANFLKL